MAPILAKHDSGNQLSIHSFYRYSLRHLYPAVLVCSMWMQRSAGEEFRIDFFPSVHYTKDAAHVHLKLNKKPALPVLLEEAGEKPTTKELKVDNRGAIAFKLDSNSLANTSVVRVLFKGGPMFQFRLLRANEGLPELDAKGGHFYDAEGIPCLLLAEFQSKPPDRRWQPIRWAAGFFITGTAPRKNHVISEFHGQDPDRPESMSPLEDAIVRVSKCTEFKSSESVTLHLGSRDIPLQTSPQFLRLNLEVILQHLNSRGAKDIRLALPIGSPMYTERLKAFKNVIHKLGHDYGARRVFDVMWYMDSELWLMPGTDNIFRKAPSMKLQEQIESVLQAEGMRTM
ncbi:MAG: hypothetical protein O3B01_04335 [Planctomycetota bacterium]|nr:hypothetical protein [Planctomycetota bacterium]